MDRTTRTTQATGLASAAPGAGPWSPYALVERASCPMHASRPREGPTS